MTKNSIFNEKSHENKRDFNPSNVLMMTQQKSLKVLMMNFVYMRRDRENNFFFYSCFCTLDSENKNSTYILPILFLKQSIFFIRYYIFFKQMGNKLQQ